MCIRDSSSLSAAQAGSFIRGGRQGMRNQQYGSNNNNISVAPTTSSTTEASPTTTPQELNAAVSSLLKTRVTWVASGVSCLLYTSDAADERIVYISGLAVSLTKKLS
eukprot:TRINITY_DN53823_c0_g1_i1.p1 TRINITY_DN53823_c0_g1~~TRINITY_DN53823_c0_g1_i1.p1  ORF type:complete len:107 (-),score=9.00 TRINITY_DN53823_c0_g1_i1:29-349(-)